MWAHVLNVLKESDGIPWEELNKARHIQSDDDHLKVSRIILSRLHPIYVKDSSQIEIISDVLVKESAGVFFLVTNTWLHELNQSYKKDLLWRLAMKYLESGILAKIVVSSSGMTEEVLTRVVSMPDLVGNTYQQCIPRPFTQDQYFRKLVISLKQVILEANMENLAALLSRLALRAKAELLNEIIFQDESLVFQSSVLLSKITDASIESILKAIFCSSKSLDHIIKLVTDEVFRRSRVQFLLKHKFTVSSYFPVTCDGRSRMPRNLIEFLEKRCHSSFFEAVKQLLTVYANASLMKSRTLNDVLYIYSLVAVSIKFLAAFSAEEKEKLRQLAMKGIQEHIKNTSTEMRQCSLFLGQTILNTLSGSHTHEAPKLDFEIDKDEFIETLETYMKPPSDNEVDVSFVKRSPQKKSHLIQVIGEDASEGELNGNVRGDDEFEDPVEPTKKPLYLTDCLEGLLEHEKHEWVLSCLEASSDLIKNNPSTARDLAVDMTKVLLYLNNECDISSFDSWRMDALISMTVVAPSSVPHYLISEFYSRNISMSTRLDVLDVLCKASQEISGRSSGKQSVQKSLEDSFSVMNIIVPQEVQDIQSNWKSIVQTRIEQKTRRFASQTKVESVSAAPNEFGKYASNFFFPLIECFDRNDIVFQVKDFDAIIVGRLIFCLGVLMDSAKNTAITRRMGRSLLPFIANFRHHRESMVREAVAFAFCSVMTSVSKVVLLEELRDELVLMKNWLLYSSESDPDEKSRNAAIQGLFLLNTLVSGDNS